MQKTLLAVAVVALVATAIPTQANHPHSTTGEYTLALGWGASDEPEYPVFVPHAVIICPSGCGNPDPDVPPIGGAFSFAEFEHEYANVDVTGQDFSNTPLPITGCLYPEGYDPVVCDPDNSSGDITCGNVAEVRAAGVDDRVTVFIRTVFVEGTNVCFGTTGSVDASWLT